MVKKICAFLVYMNTKYANLYICNDIQYLKMFDYEQEKLDLSHETQSNCQPTYNSKEF